MKLFFAVSCLVLGACAGAQLSPADQAAIAVDAATIAKCQLQARECKEAGRKDCYDAVYIPCMKAGGLH